MVIFMVIYDLDGPFLLIIGAAIAQVKDGRMSGGAVAYGIADHIVRQ